MPGRGIMRCATTSTKPRKAATDRTVASSDQPTLQPWVRWNQAKIAGLVSTATNVAARPSRRHSRASASGSALAAVGTVDSSAYDIRREYCARSGRVDGDVLRREVLVDALGAALATEAGLLDAAERGRRVGDDALVEPDHPGLERLDHAQRAVEVAR